MTIKGRPLYDYTKRGEIHDAQPPLSPAPRSAWQCDLGNGEWDHDWQEKTESSGELDGGPGDHWTWRECRVCGKIETPNTELSGGEQH